MKCQTKSKAFALLEKSIKLNVNHPPKFLTEIPDMSSLTYGSKILLNCTTRENPPKESIHWFFMSKNGVKYELIEEEDVSILEIPESLDSEQGQYECVVKNRLGEVKRTFDVDLSPLGNFFFVF